MKADTLFRRMVAVAGVVLTSVSARVQAADLKVTDSRGTEVVVSGASIDYSGFVSAEKESDGIRLLQGDGEVTVKWADVESLRVLRRDESVKPPRIEAEVTLRGGKKVPAALLRLGQMKLVGKTDLGTYSIALDKVRAIVPVR
jgi:hypothetical protein